MFVCAHTHRPEPSSLSALLSGRLTALPGGGVSLSLTPHDSTVLPPAGSPHHTIAPALLPISCLCPLWKEAPLLPSLPVAVVNVPSDGSSYRGAASSLTSTLPTTLPSSDPGLAWPQEPQHLLDWIFFARLSPACKASPLPTCRPTPIHSR